jgi:curved DNA-binding protein CbpA
MNAFAILGLPEQLVFSEEEIRAAFREAGKRLHPDAGGAEGEFAALKEAQAILTSPSKRLRHWLELRGVEIETRGVIGGELMGLFGEIGGVTQRAETLIRKRESAQSALAKALLEGETQVCREEVETAIRQVDGAINEACADFPVWEQREPANSKPQMEQVVRNLAFLEKWRAGLRACYSRLV